jgi:tetratricopeptide (TPR) repeat protein
MIPTVPARRSFVVAAVLALLAWIPAAAQHHNRHDDRALAEDPRLAPGQLAPVLEGLGDNHYPVTTSSEQAQAFFDQGLKLTYGFNHQEALRAFKEAARLDPDCAMAYWGWALVLGPNLNLPMRPEVVGQAWDAVHLALARKDGVSEKERGLIDALATRYTDDPEADRTRPDRAYADAMGKLHERYPEDNDLATLYAAALMNTMPWDYWTRDGHPKARTGTVVDVLEAVIERDPHHEGALHYYIHIIEPVDARRGERAADLLRGLAPGAGHLVHMPSHIYMQLGRYAEALDANVAASAADEGYITQCRAQGIYPLNYYPHNVHFVAWAAMMRGRSAQALEAARKLADAVPDDMHGNDWALYETFLGMPLFVMARFGMWEAVLAEPQPPKGARYWTGIWHYARGLAFVHRDEPGEARHELKALRKLAGAAKSGETMIGFADAGRLLEIAREVLEGELDARARRFDTAIAHLDRALRLEAALAYNEPPDWYYPVRHTLGAVLLEAGRLDEAATVYWQDLEENPDNGFALFGLWQALKTAGDHSAASAIGQRYRTAWADADVKLSTSRF